MWTCIQLDKIKHVAVICLLYLQEACKLETEVFGPMGLSEEEYQEVYKQTGLDVDNRQSLLSTMVVMLDEAIHCYIAFVKTIPGFSELSLADQIKLIRSMYCFSN